MAWVRIDDQAPRHEKMLKAGPAACWLWVCALAHSQSQLTDGFISALVLPMIGVTGAARVLRLAAVLVEAGLFERVEGGYQIHDYLAFNDTRAEAIMRRASRHDDKANAGRAGARKRWQTDSRPIADRDSRGIADEDSRPIADRNSRPIAEGHSRRMAPTRPDPTRPDLKGATHLVPAKKPPDPRVREFLLWFQGEYRAKRHGAEYLVKWDKHGTLVKQMLGATELDRLKKYAQILLSDKTDDEWITSTDRGVETLSARFSWLSDRLAAWEARQKAQDA